MQAASADPGCRSPEVDVCRGEWGPIAGRYQGKYMRFSDCEFNVQRRWPTTVAAAHARPDVAAAEARFGFPCRARSYASARAALASGRAAPSAPRDAAGAEAVGVGRMPGKLGATAVGR